MTRSDGKVTEIPLSNLWAVRRGHVLVSLLLDPASDRAWLWRIEAKTLGFLLARYGSRPAAFPLAVEHPWAGNTAEAIPNRPDTSQMLSRERIGQILRQIAKATASRGRA